MGEEARTVRCTPGPVTTDKHRHPLLRDWHKAALSLKCTADTPASHALGIPAGAQTREDAQP